jgi:hypothetical protein
VLWPDAVRHAIKTGPDREIVAVYPFRSACPKSVWRQLIASSTRELTFAGYTNYFLWLEQPNLRTVLRRKADGGCRVRFLVGDPNSEITRHREEVEDVPLTVGTRIRITLDELGKLRDVPNIATRLGDEHIAMSVFVFDHEMLVTPHLANLVGHDSPTLTYGGTRTMACSTGSPITSTRCGIGGGTRRPTRTGRGTDPECSSRMLRRPCAGP